MDLAKLSDISVQEICDAFEQSYPDVDICECDEVCDAWLESIEQQEVDKTA